MIEIGKTILMIIGAAVVLTAVTCFFYAAYEQWSRYWCGHDWQLRDGQWECRLWCGVRGPRERT